MVYESVIQIGSTTNIQSWTKKDNFNSIFYLPSKRQFNALFKNSQICKIKAVATLQCSQALWLQDYNNTINIVYLLIKVYCIRGHLWSSLRDNISDAYTCINIFYYIILGICICQKVDEKIRRL